MRRQKWLAALAAVLALGLLGAGCGDDDETTTSTVGEATTSGEDTTTTEVTTTSDDTSSRGATPDDFYNACIDVVEGTAAESTGQRVCEQARDALEQCQTQAENVPEGPARDTAIQACQDAADQTVDQLKATSGG